MSLNTVFFMRHAERLDRHIESLGGDWISTARRPQDPILSPHGEEQAKEVGRQLLLNIEGKKIKKILCSPMIRTCQTATIISEVLGLGLNSVCIEMGLTEEAKSFRGKTANEPNPVWDPIYHSPYELTQYSSLIDLSYVPLINKVNFVKDDSLPNKVREDHDTLTNGKEILIDRCEKFVTLLTKSFFIEEENEPYSILCVGHGASVKACANAISDVKLTGDNPVSCWQGFVRNVENDKFTPMSLTWEKGGINFKKKDENF